ncbi:MAG: pseudouridine synthase [Gammaproteobacteria bacterium]
MVESQARRGRTAAKAPRLRTRASAEAPPERVQKALARAGLGSRRLIETWIAAGRVQINRRIAQPGDRAGPSDEIRIDGQTVAAARRAPPRRRVIAYYKPAGVLCSTRDERGDRPTVFGRLPEAGRWIAIGRLDLNSSGLLLFTNDGALAHRLMHPSFGLEREYAVRVLGAVDGELLERLTQGIALDDGWARFASVTATGGQGSNRWFHVVLREGRKREVRRLWESQGLRVSRLIRIRYGNILLPPDKQAGEWWEVDGREVERLSER